MQLPEFDLEKFDLEIIELCKREITLLEAIVIWCDDNNIELDLISQIINKRHPSLKLRIEDQARRNNTLKKLKK